VIYNQTLTRIDFVVRYLRVQSMAVPGRFAGESNESAARTAGIGKNQNQLHTNRFPGVRATVRVCGGIGAAVALAFATGCGNQYRPVINPVRPTGPSPVPTAYAMTVTQPVGAAAGIATVIDFSGDTVLAQASIGNFPLDFTLDVAGGNTYTIDRDGSLSVFAVSPSLQTKTVATSSLSATALPINSISGTGNLYVVDQASDQLDVLTGSPPGLKQAIQFPLGLINLAGRSASSRFYGIVQNVAPTTCANPGAVTTPGSAYALEVSTLTISTPSGLPVGICPVYGLASVDGLRSYILNRGSGTVTVIDSQKNALDTQSNPATGYANSTFTLPAGPVYGEIYDAANQLVTVNYDSNTISVIDITTDVFDNDGPTFGTIHNIPVGNGPSSVTVLQDGSRAYVANSKDGTISVVNLSSYTVQKTITLPLNQDGTTPHPRTVVSTYNYPEGKVYVNSPDSQNLVILRTDTDTVDATLQLQGNVIDTRVTRQNATTTTQTLINSYSPGNGVPCTPGTVPTQLSTNPTACELEANPSLRK
jgi:YVTN family beta-propeller protein